MQFTSANVLLRATRWIDATDGKVLPGMYGNKPGRIERVTLDYVLRSGTQKWEAQSLNLHGVAVKQDGTDSKNTFTQSVYSWDLKRNPEQWAWLTELIDRARPTATPVFPSSFEGREY
jgi:hypothetical protein